MTKKQGLSFRIDLVFLSLDIIKIPVGFCSGGEGYYGLIFKTAEQFQYSRSAVISEGGNEIDEFVVAVVLGLYPGKVGSHRAFSLFYAFKTDFNGIVQEENRVGGGDTHLHGGVVVAVDDPCVA